MQNTTSSKSTSLKLHPAHSLVSSKRLSPVDAAEAKVTCGVAEEVGVGDWALAIG